MKFKLKNKLFFGLIIFLVLFFFVGFANSMSIEPLRQTVVVAPGEIKELKLLVINNEKTLKVFAPEIDSFTIDSNTGRAVFGNNDNARTWFKMEPKELSLKAGEKGEFTFRVIVPKSAEPGAHYLALFAKTLNEGGQIGISERAGSLLFLYVAGEVVEDLVLTDFSSTKQVYFSKGFDFNVSLKNSGTIHLDPQGTIILKNLFNQKIGEVSLNQSQRKILPGGEWNEKISIKNFPNFNFGPVKAELYINYGITRNVVSDVETFWFLPWWGFVGLALIICMVFVPIVFFKKKRKIRI